ncbi:hypothetical protein CEXT_789831 [Caerostris extrusa]|uniref:Uncharacterized protein n=1 Tax=Caerostris extrusa TaxID=172846 RepID=A0AAV4MK38_CAEEX|nr:hypothetical protein CEXT_789831 [Caerostris extrusa]
MASSNSTAGRGKKNNVQLITDGLWHDNIATSCNPYVDDGAGYRARGQVGEFPLLAGQFNDSQEPLHPRRS